MCDTISTETTSPVPCNALYIGKELLIADAPPAQHGLGVRIHNWEAESRKVAELLGALLEYCQMRLRDLMLETDAQH